MHVVLAEFSWIRAEPLMLLGGVAGLFAAGRFLMSLAALGSDSPLWRAFSLFVPIAFASLGAAWLGQPQLAVGIVFGASVGALTTVVGLTTLSADITAGPRRFTRLWPFAAVAAVLAFVAGFKGYFHWRDALALMVEGLLVYYMTSERAGLDNPADEWPPAVSSASGESRARTGRVAWLTIELALIAALLTLASWAVTAGAMEVSRLNRRLSIGALAGSVIALSLVMPMTWGLWRIGAAGKAWSILTSQVVIVLLNLCCLLPALILLPYLATVFPSIFPYATDALALSDGRPRMLLFPAPVWRIDAVILMVAGIFIMPVAAGKWAIGKEEGMVLIAGYFFYLTAVLAMG